MNKEEGISNGLDLAKVICEYVGVQWEHTMSVDIKIRPDSPVEVEVHKWLSIGGENKIIKTLLKNE